MNEEFIKVMSENIVVQNKALDIMLDTLIKINENLKLINEAIEKDLKHGY